MIRVRPVSRPPRKPLAYPRSPERKNALSEPLAASEGVLEIVSAADADNQDQPVICLLTSPESAGRGLEIALKTEDWEHDVFVGVRGDDSEILELFNRFTVAGIIQFPRDTPLDTVRSEFQTWARDQGYPGMIFHETAYEFDLPASRDKFKRQETYAIESADDQNTEYGTIVGVPAYNEEIGIGSVVNKAQQYADEVIVVDDGSTDDTVDIAKDAGATVIEHETNRGKGAAVQTLLEYIQDCKFGTAVLIDGDGQHLPSQIPKVTEPVVEKGIDVAIGSRYLGNGSDDETPRYRRFGQKALDILTLGSTGRNLTDTQSGFRAFSQTAVDKLDLSTDGIGVESEMIDSASQKDLDIAETPIDVRYEGIDGQTYNPLHHGLSVVTFVLRLVRDRHPLIFFGGPGLGLIIIGTLWGLDAILTYQATGNFYPGKVLAGGFTTIIGVLGIFCGLILNRISNMIGEINKIVSVFRFLQFVV